MPQDIQAQLQPCCPLNRVVVIQNLWVEQMDGNRRMPLPDGHTAALNGKRYVGFNVSCVWRDDIEQFFVHPLGCKIKKDAFQRPKLCPEGLIYKKAPKGTDTSGRFVTRLL